jgi:dihydropyrimidine dehydrogenase (NAD+) subunit PreA
MIKKTLIPQAESKDALSEHNNLSVDLAGVQLKNPFLPGASELALNGPSAARLIKAGVGAVVTKSFTSSSRMRIRVRPYQFSLAKFGSEFGSCGSFMSLSAPHVEDLDAILKKNVPGMAEICRAHQIPLITSFYESFKRFGQWPETAMRFEDAGADLIELNFSSPSNKEEMEEHPEISSHIISSVRKKVRVPVGIKISPTVEPLNNLVKNWVNAGVSFITAHNAPSGIFIDVEREEPYGAPSAGGYSIGRPFLPWSLARVVQIKKAAPNIPVIGVGGIFEWQDALQYILCGCSAVEICTGAYTKGLNIFKNIEKGVTTWMRRKGYSTIEAFQGKVLPLITVSRELKSKEKAPFMLPPEGPYTPRVKKSRCNLCFRCGKQCLYGVFHIKNKKLIIDENKCWSCGFCISLCPEKALVLVDRITGETIWDGEGTAAPFKSSRQSQ